MVSLQIILDILLLWVMKYCTVYLLLQWTAPVQGVTLKALLTPTSECPSLFLETAPEASTDTAPTTLPEGAMRNGYIRGIPLEVPASGNREGPARAPWEAQLKLSYAPCPSYQLSP